ncbi:MAG: LamG-like jellyroll fold domain-containing protein [Sedimentisphaerales bacterium]
MKNRVIWIMFMVVALVASGAWAFSPLTNVNGTELLFNLNFENNNDPCTIDAKAGLRGHRSCDSGYEDHSGEANLIAPASTIYETAYAKSGLGTDANFCYVHDHDTTTPNDVRIRIPITMTNISGYDAGHEIGDSMFDLAGAPPTSPVRTWAFWMRFMPKNNTLQFLNDAATVLHAGCTAGSVGAGGLNNRDPNYYWEIRLYNSKIQFQQKNGSTGQGTLLTVETADSVANMGVDPRTWHHVAVVVDRNAQANTKIYFDGLQRAVNVVDYRTTSALALCSWTYGSTHYYIPLTIGAGISKCNELLDEIRLYNRALTPLEVSILKQTDTIAKPIALLPIPGSTDVKIDTDVNWVPAAGVVSQNVYFGTNPGALNLIPTNPENHTPGLNIVYNNKLKPGDSNALALSTIYYWAVDSDFGSGPVDGPSWSFTTETGKAKNPTPTNGQQRVSGIANNIKVMWDEPKTHPSTYSVYLSTSQTLVEANDPSVRILDALDVNYASKVIPDRGTTFFWRVISNYTGQTVSGYTWSFRTLPYEIIFNTSEANSIGVTPATKIGKHGKKVVYSGHDVNSLAMVIKDAGWAEVAYGTLERDGDVNVAVFKFSTGFSYDSRYDIVVIPTYNADGIHHDNTPAPPAQWNPAKFDVNQPRPLSIRVTGNFYFDGQLHIDGNNITITGTSADKYAAARCGGFPGPKTNCGDSAASVFNDHTTLVIPTTNYWTLINAPSCAAGHYTTHSRVCGPGNPTGKFTVIPNDLAKTIWGPGQPASCPYKGAAGGSYGGQGGVSGRGYYFGVEATYGRTYGDTSIPFPWGGSAGAWSQNGAGSSGGGGIEIIATGDITLDTHCQMTTNGGSATFPPATSYPGSGAAGGSLKFIAGGAFTNNGLLTANGGNGGFTSKQENEATGGGGGGRIAVNAGSTPINNGTITVDGGAEGTFLTSGVYVGCAENGKEGTILLTTDSPKIAAAPEPKNGDTKYYIGTADSNSNFTLTWWSGYNASTDRVWIGTNSGHLLDANTADKVATARGKKTQVVSVNKNTTYYWQVKTDSGTGNPQQSPIWSFTTVNWVCQLAVNYGAQHVEFIALGPLDANGMSANDTHLGIGGPEWDHDRDCVLNDADFWYFAKDWQNQGLGLKSHMDGTWGINGGTVPAVAVDIFALRRFASEWLDCYARTNSGCAGITDAP